MADSSARASNLNQHHLLQKVMVPAALLTYGITSLHSPALVQLDRYINGSTLGAYGYDGAIDDYLRYGPVAGVYALDLLGVKAKHHFIDRTAMLLISMALTSTLVSSTKSAINRERPDGAGFRSFPSSHTAMAFMSAEFMHQEYKDHSAWYSVIGYAAATTTGVLRLYHHVHWLSDVVMGAGYGLLSTKIAYLIYPYLKTFVQGKKQRNAFAVPSLQNGKPGLYLSYQF